MGGGLPTAWLVTVLTAVLNGLLNWVYSQRLLPEMAVPGICRAQMGPMLKFGLGMITSGIVALILINAEKLLLAAYATRRRWRTTR